MATCSTDTGIWTASRQTRCFKSAKLRSDTERPVEAIPKFFLVAIPVAMVVVARIVGVVAMMVVPMMVAVAIRCVAIAGVHRLLGRCSTR